MLSIELKQAEHAKKYWPGALSLEFSTPNAPPWLHRGNKFFAIRMPNSQKLLNLINETGPLISTSANLQGQTPAQSVTQAQAVFGDRLEFYVDAGPLKGLPSTLAKSENGKLTVIRQGAVKIKP